MSLPLFALLTSALTVDVEGCEEDLAKRVRALVALELSVANAAFTDAPPLFSLRCDKTQASLRFMSEEVGVERALELKEVKPAAWSRLIALALVELAHAPELRENTALTLTDGLLAEAAGPPAPERGARLTGRVGLTHPGALGVSASVDLRLRFGPTWGVRGGVTGLFAEKADPLGHLRILAPSASLAGTGQWAVSSWELEFGVGARAGYAWLEGESASSLVEVSGVEGTWGGPMVTMAFGAPLLQGVRFGFEVEAGLPLVRVVGQVDGASSLGIENVWVQAGLLAQFDL